MTATRTCGSMPLTCTLHDGREIQLRDRNAVIFSNDGDFTIEFDGPINQLDDDVFAELLSRHLIREEAAS